MRSVPKQVGANIFKNREDPLDTAVIDAKEWDKSDLKEDWGRVFFTEALSTMLLTTLVVLTREFSGSIILVSLVRSLGLLWCVTAFSNKENAGFAGQLGISLPLCLSGLLYPKNRSWSFLIYLIAALVGSFLGYLCVYILTLDVSYQSLGVYNIPPGVSTGVAFFSEFLGGIFYNLAILLPLTLQFSYYRYPSNIDKDRDGNKINKGNVFSKKISIMASPALIIGGLGLLPILVAFSFTSESCFDVFYYLMPKLFKAPSAFTYGDWVYPLAAVLSTFVAGSVNYLYSWYFPGKYHYAS